MNNNDVKREAVVVDVTDGAHGQMEVQAYVFRLDQFVFFPHDDGFPEWTFITLRLHNDAVWQARVDERLASRLYQWKAEQRPWGRGVRDFVLKGVIRRSWATVDDENDTHTFVNHMKFGLVKIPHHAWEGRDIQQFEIRRMLQPELFNGQMCHFQVERTLDRYESDLESDSDDSDGSFEAPVWVPQYILRQRVREARGQRRIE